MVGALGMVVAVTILATAVLTRDAQFIKRIAGLYIMLWIGYHVAPAVVAAARWFL